MITIYQIQVTDEQIDALNAGKSVPSFEAKRSLMFGASEFTPDMLQYFTEVARVDTDDLERAFELTNLWEDTSKVEKFTRMSSTSVGDIFLKGDAFYMVDNFGFKTLRLFNDEIEMMECA
jgi:hypothetical protein